MLVQKKMSDGITAVIVVFLLLVVTKLALVMPYFYGPVLFFDEWYYRQFAEQLISQGYYGNAQYPLFYPLLISPALFFGEYFYEAIKVLNILYSSAIVFPTWLIARMYLDKEASLWCVIVSAVLPYHLAFPGMVMSENIYYFLFLMAMYAVLKVHTRHIWFWTIGTGVLLGLLHLTRHMSLAITPLLILTWFFKPLDVEEKLFTINKLKHLGILLLSMIAAYSPWLIMQFFYSDLFNAIGKKFIVRELTFSLDMKLLWVCIVVMYVILMVAPVLHIITLTFSDWKKRFWSDAIGRYQLLCALLIMGFVFIVARHHWGARYNISHPDHIHGRYLLYVAVPLIILSAIYLRKSMMTVVSKFRIFLACIMASALLLYSYMFLIERRIMEIPSWFLMNHIAHDGYIFNLLPRFIPILLILFILFSGHLIARQSRYAFGVVFTCLIGFLCVGGYYFFPMAIWHRETALHGQEMAKVIREKNILENLTIYVPNGTKNSQNIQFHLQFWGINTSSIFIADDIQFKEAYKAGDGFLRTTKKIPMHNPATEYTVRGIKHYIYDISSI